MRIYFLSILFLSGIYVPADQPVPVPKTGTAVIDGKISASEWQDAAPFNLHGAGELWLKTDGEDLYVCLKGQPGGWAHVYVSDSERIYVLHASAALGTAIYRRGENETWQPAQSFSWGVRDTTMSEAAVKMRDAFFKENGWVASTARMGHPGSIEFKISGKFFKTDPVLAVAYAAAAESPDYWPEDLSDDCLKAELIFGKTPADLKFDKSGWRKLKF